MDFKYFFKELYTLYSKKDSNLSISNPLCGIQQNRKFCVPKRKYCLWVHYTSPRNWLSAGGLSGAQNPPDHRVCWNLIRRLSLNRRRRLNLPRNTQDPIRLSCQCPGIVKIVNGDWNKCFYAQFQSVSINRTQRNCSDAVRTFYFARG